MFKAIVSGVIGPERKTAVGAVRAAIKKSNTSTKKLRCDIYQNDCIFMTVHSTTGSDGLVAEAQSMMDDLHSRY